nr:hypothetical protein [Secundilactobacillus kimchicus]
MTPANSKAFQVEFGAAGQNISLTTKSKIEKAHLTGLNFVQQQARLYPNGTFASNLIGNVTTQKKSVSWNDGTRTSLQLDIKWA